MSTFSYGWVEVRTGPAGPWRGVIVINPIFWEDYTVFATLFGVRWPIEWPDGSTTPLAAHRGIPADASGDVIFEAVLESEGAGQYGHSWVLWSEVEHTWLATDTTALTAGWYALRELMAVLARFYSSDHVRLVIWFT